MGRAFAFPFPKERIMKRKIHFAVALMAVWLGIAAACDAQVFVRAPFVRVGVGDGVYVRAPFVNLYVPNGPPVYYAPGPRVYYMPPPTVLQSPPPAEQTFPPAPQPVPAPKPLIKDDAPPQPVQQPQTPTLESFAKTFQPKAGSYEVTILNPVTNQPTNVKFFLPEGSPRRVRVTRDSIEFIYGLRQWTLIEFDRDGAKVTSR
jgi:hypothetical protein